MLDKEQIINYLNTLQEHKMAKDIFVPILQRMGCEGVKFTGGPDEVGIDIEYYELTKPENLRSYVGVQFKKGKLVYSSGGGKNSVKELKNQAEEAFDKEMHDIDTHATLYISRFVVATTGEINEKARAFIGKARQKGNDRRIDYWDGDRLAEYVQNYWMDDFINYFDITSQSEEENEGNIIDVEYIEENFEDLVNKCQGIRATINTHEWRIIRAIFDLSISSNGGVSISDLLLELGNNEDYFRGEFQQLSRLEYIFEEERNISLSGNAYDLLTLYSDIEEELIDAEEDPTQAIEIFNDLIDD